MSPAVPAPTPRLSVVIPTKNGGARFAEALRVILDQDAGEPYEVVIVDSGSTDGTVRLCQGYGLRVIQIAPEEFGHGRTRNLAIGACRGEYVALTVQDAVPTDRGWLRTMVEALDAHPRAAGVYGRQVPHPGAGYLARRAAHYWHERAGGPLVQRIDDVGAFDALAPEERQERCTFNNVSSLLRRSAWEAEPFPEIPYAEDLAWSLRVMRAGWEVLYWPASCVYHSHERPLGYELARAYVDARTVGEVLGAPRRPLGAAQAEGLLAAWRDLTAAEGVPEPGWLARLRAEGEAALDLAAQYRPLFSAAVLRAMVGEGGRYAPAAREALVREMGARVAWAPYNARAAALPDTARRAESLRALRGGQVSWAALRGAWAGGLGGDVAALARVLWRRLRDLPRRIVAVASSGRAEALTPAEWDDLFASLWYAMDADHIRRAVLLDVADPAREVEATRLRGRQIAADLLLGALREGEELTNALYSAIYRYAATQATGRRLGEAARYGAEGRLADLEAEFAGVV